MAGRRKQPPLKEDKLVCLTLARSVQPFFDSMKVADAAEHGNLKLGLGDTLVVLLCAFFNPTVRSLRLIEQLSQMNWAQKHLEVDRICRSTLSDALGRFDPKRLIPVINGLMEQLPDLARKDDDLAGVAKRLVAADGSTFDLAADVAWAIIRRRGGAGGNHGTCRLNLQLDIDTFTPAELSVSGADDGSEAGAFARQILPGVTYLFDRNFMHFGLINRVLDAGSDLVLRLRSSTKFEVTEERALTAEDLAAGVLSDRVGTLPGGPGGRTGPPPRQLLREVIVQGDDGKPVRLLTNILDLPARVIAAIYRQRWQIELFFRWLKVSAAFEHLYSHSKSGVTTQFYVAVIGCLLMHLRTGRRVNKYALFLFGQVAAGLATLDEILPMLERIEREKALERIRLAKKRAQKQLAPPLKIQ